MKSLPQIFENENAYINKMYLINGFDSWLHLGVSGFLFLIFQLARDGLKGRYMVIVPQYDALVLTLCINGFDVHKVLVDPGNAADLLQLPAFIQMTLSSDMLNSIGRILYGFNGATTVTLEDVTFPMKAGPVTQRVLFSIVVDLGPYNAIVGRTWLHSMKVVPSTYHQMVSYLTNVGQVDLLSN